MVSQAILGVRAYTVSGRNKYVGVSLLVIDVVVVVVSSFILASVFMLICRLSASMDCHFGGKRRLVVSNKGPCMY